MAYRRHFPAINWLNSYSLYRDRLTDWFGENIATDWIAKTGEIARILGQESDLQEIVKLVGADALSPDDRMTLETAQSIREDFLQQNAFDGDDSYTSLAKMYALMNLIFSFDKKARAALALGADVSDIAALPVRERIGRAKAVPEATYQTVFAEIENEVDAALAALPKGGTV